MFYAYGYDKDEKGVSSKVSRIAGWEQVQKSGITPKGLQDKPDLDDNLTYLWNDYCDIRKGCENISYLELQAYQNVSGNNLTPWEVSMMLELDLIRRQNG